MAEDSRRLESMSALQAVADRVAQGMVPDTSDARAIAESHDLIAVGMMADDVRRRLHGAQTTFLRVSELDVRVGQPKMAGTSAGEYRLIGRPASAAAAIASIIAARSSAGAAFVTGFSLAAVLELQGAADDLFARLRSAGLDGIAETAVDGQPAREIADAVRAARAAGLVVQRLTVTSPPSDPLALLGQVQQLQASIGGFRAFAPLPRAIAGAAPTTGFADVKLVALARLLIRDIPSMQVDWPLYGPKLAQVALTVGADDIDGVAASTTTLLGPRRSPLEEVRRNIEAAGLQPVERDGWFEARAEAGGAHAGHA